MTKEDEEPGHRRTASSLRCGPLEKLTRDCYHFPSVREGSSTLTSVNSPSPSRRPRPSGWMLSLTPEPRGTEGRRTARRRSHLTSVLVSRNRGPVSAGPAAANFTDRCQWVVGIVLLRRGAKFPLYLGSHSFRVFGHDFLQ